MYQIKTVTVGASAKVSRNYQSAEAYCEIAAELEPGVDPEDAYTELHERAKSMAVPAAEKALAELLGEVD